MKPSLPVFYGGPPMVSDRQIIIGLAILCGTVHNPISILVVSIFFRDQGPSLKFGWTTPMG